jgi:hypothetical protein
MADQDYDELQDVLTEKADQEEHEKDKMDVDNRSIYTVKGIIQKKAENAQDDRKD